VKTAAVIGLGRALAAGVLLGLLSVQPVFAGHIIPDPLWWWDLNDNRLVEANDSIVGFGASGGNWTQEKHNDVAFSTAAWSTVTDYNPFDASGGIGVIRGTIRVDTTEPWCEDNYIPDIVGVTCRRGTPIREGGVITFYDIFDMDVGINSEDHQWNFGADDPGGNQYDFRGVLAHELGHTLRLRDSPLDQCGNPTITMCGGGPPGLDSKQLRSLETHDINAANQVYP
jgi:hypothetical protein